MVKTKKMKKYSAQVLAVVLVVLFVGVIIALALMARTTSDQRQTTEERGSADAVDIADVVLNSVKDIEFKSLMEWLGGDPVCTKDSPTYDFITDGCDLDIDGFQVFTDNFDLDTFYDSVLTSLTNNCNFESPDEIGDSFNVSFSIFDEDDFLEIEKDSVFAFVYKADNSNPCTVDLVTESLIDGSPTGVVFSTIYGQVDPVTKELTQYKPYDFTDIVGQCINDECNTDPNWLDGWQSYAGPDRQTNTFQNVKSFGSSDYYLYEIRVRPVGNNILLARDGSSSGSCPYEQLIWVEAEVTCKGNYRGKNFVLSGEDWAPALFDYVLYNGNGTLQYDN